MHMLHFPKRVLVLAAVCLPAACLAADQAPAQAALDPDAIAALERMGAYLRSLTAFEVEARTATENVMDDGFKLQFDGAAHLKVRRPDRLQVDISNARKQRQIFYDGKSVTVYGPRLKYYATVPAPPTLRETVEVLARKYGIETPLADLFYWGSEESAVADIKVARHIGPATIDGKQADQYAFRQDGVDWQLWIQQGAQALPLKMAITSTAQPAQPTYTVGLRWNVAARPQETAFVFKPPPGAMKIVMQTADGKPVSIK
jgi:hypothetical protein